VDATADVCPSLHYDKVNTKKITIIILLSKEAQAVIESSKSTTTG